MPSSAVRQRTLPQVQPLRRLRSRPPWWRQLPWVLLLGLLAIGRVNTQARLSELEAESRRLQRLVVAQDMRQADLVRERARLTSDERLGPIMQKSGMQAPPATETVPVGVLPAPKIYWNLPDSLNSGSPPAPPAGPAPAPPANTGP